MSAPTAPAPAAPAAAPSQTDILAALASQSATNRRIPPATVAYAHLADDHESLTLTAPDGKKTNSRKLYCPREGCSCVIIGIGAAEWVEAAADLLPTEAGSPFEPTGTEYWYVTGSPFAFDNIGFSRPDATTAVSPDLPGAGNSKVKWLICAECDLGPIGWSFEGGSEAWLAVNRLRYSP